MHSCANVYRRVLSIGPASRTGDSGPYLPKEVKRRAGKLLPVLTRRIRPDRCCSHQFSELSCEASQVRTRLIGNLGVRGFLKYNHACGKYHRWIPASSKKFVGPAEVKRHQRSRVAMIIPFQNAERSDHRRLQAIQLTRHRRRLAIRA